jgi:hypothetical protein
MQGAFQIKLYLSRALNTTGVCRPYSEMLTLQALNQQCFKKLRRKVLMISVSALISCSGDLGVEAFWTSTFVSVCVYTPFLCP